MPFAAQCNACSSRLTFLCCTGCFCSIGGCQECLGLSAADVEESLRQGRTCQDSTLDLVGGTPTGAVRVSVGYMTDPAGAADRLLGFVTKHFVDQINPRAVSRGDGGHAEEEELEEGGGGRDLSGSTLRGPSCAPSEVYLHSIFVYPIKSCAGGLPLLTSCHYACDVVVYTACD